MKGLPNSCDKHKLIQAFRHFGEIDKAYILYDHNNGASRGFGFVEFMREEDLLKSLEFPVIIDGKTIKCSRVFLKQEGKIGQEQPTNSSKQTWPTKEQKQASENMKAEVVKNKKFKGKELNLEGSIAWTTKKTRGSSGSSSEEQEELSDIFMSNRSPNYNQGRDNFWNSPQEESHPRFFPQEYPIPNQVYGPSSGFDSSQNWEKNGPTGWSASPSGYGEQDYYFYQQMRPNACSVRNQAWTHEAIGMKSHFSDDRSSSSVYQHSQIRMPIPSGSYYKMF